MAEWFKAAVLKTVEGRKVLREFESLSLRQKIPRREISLLANGSRPVAKRNWKSSEGDFQSERAGLHGAI
jgi:hypothetical protein